MGEDSKEQLSREKREQLDRLLVCGELVDGFRVWPSQARAAEIFGITEGQTGAHSSVWGCLARRQVFAQTGAYAAPPLHLRAQARKDWIQHQISGTQGVTVPPPPEAKPKLVKVDPPAPPEEEPSVPDDPFEDAGDPNAPAYDREPGEEPKKRKGPIHPPAVRPAIAPRRCAAPIIPWEEVDRLLVMGEITENEDGTTATYYPTQLELAARFGIHQTVISKYWRNHNCEDRREKAKYRLAIRTEEKIIEKRADLTAMTKERAVAIIDEYTMKFEQTLKEGKMRFDSVVDLNAMLRLKEFLLGGADSRQEIQGALTLQAIQGRHETYIEVQADSEEIPELEGDAESLGDQLLEGQPFEIDDVPVAVGDPVGSPLGDLQPPAETPPVRCIDGGPPAALSPPVDPEPEPTPEPEVPQSGGVAASVFEAAPEDVGQGQDEENAFLGTLTDEE